MSNQLTPGSILSMSREAADILIELNNGDASLVYLYLLCDRSLDNLSWPQDRLQDALTLLQRHGMAPSSVQTPVTAPPGAQRPMELTQETINDSLADPNSQFSYLCDEVEKHLGKRLSSSDMRELYQIYEQVGLPAEVILILVGWCCTQMELTYGAGRKPRMSLIHRYANDWAKRGITSAEAADEHIRRMARMKSRETEIIQLLDLPPRPLVASEKNFIAAWDHMGFENDAIRLAYERCVARKKEMNWNYMNGILRNWHEKNLHTAAAVEAADRRNPYQNRSYASSSSELSRPTRPEDADEQTKRDMEEVRRLLEELDRT